MGTFGSVASLLPTPYIKECMIGATSYRISDQLRDIHCAPYASVVGMLLHTNGKFIVRKDIKDCVFHAYFY